MRRQLPWQAVGITAFQLAIVIPDGVLAGESVGGRGDADKFSTESLTKRSVVVFQENASCDHYFGSFPRATNLPAQPPDHAKDVTAYISP
jgi:phospholipase C